MTKRLANDERTPTGALQFDDDWPGVFIRGDDALGYAKMLRDILSGRFTPDMIRTLPPGSRLHGFIDLLESCSTLVKAES
jgi:hypothetical protein